LAGDWDVVVAPTPEAEKALASLAASLSAPPGAGGHFADGATPEVVGRFFAAAAPVFRAAPWPAATDAEGAGGPCGTAEVASLARKRSRGAPAPLNESWGHPVSLRGP